MAGGIYLRQGEKLIAMAEQRYAAEDILQKLLEDYPELLWLVWLPRATLRESLGL